jgi:hypothetical protein
LNGGFLKALVSIWTLKRRANLLFFDFFEILCYNIFINQKGVEEMVDVNKMYTYLRGLAPIVLQKRRMWFVIRCRCIK